MSYGRVSATKPFRQSRLLFPQWIETNGFKRYASLSEATVVRFLSISQCRYTRNVINVQFLRIGSFFIDCENNLESNVCDVIFLHFAIYVQFISEHLLSRSRFCARFSVNYFVISIILTFRSYYVLPKQITNWRHVKQSFCKSEHLAIAFDHRCLVISIIIRNKVRYCIIGILFVHDSCNFYWLRFSNLICEIRNSNCNKWISWYRYNDICIS